jgi:ribonuclease R
MKKRQNRSSPGKSDKGRFLFRDRTGKVHGGGGHAAPSERTEKSERSHKPARAEKRPEKVPEKFSGKPSRKFQKNEKRHGEKHREDRSGEKRGRRERKSREPVRLKATVDKNHKGFAFLLFEDRRYEDAFVPPREAQTLFHGDRVQVSIDSEGDVTEVEILEHRFREIVGRFSPHFSGTERGGFVIYERKRAREEVFVPKVGPGVRSGDWVRAKLEFHEEGQYLVTAEITEVYGQELPASADLGMVAAEYNLVEEHSPEAVDEAQSWRLEIPGKDLEGREDLRDVPLITIDGETARDFDDAVYVEPHHGGFILWVAIADVSHYVTLGSALDRDARSRGTSVYFPERAFHMLPGALSENLCSLRPNEPRLALVSKIEFDRQGKRKKTEVIEAVIESKRRATYNQIQAERDANEHNRDWEFTAHFDLYKILRKARSDRGSIDFDLPEAELNVQPDGEVISIKQRPRLDAHRLIEEFMIAANEAVTDWIMARKWPFIYRVHEEPAQQSLQKFQQLAATLGVHFSLESSGKKASSPKDMAELIRRLEGHPAQHMLNMAFLRSMKQAIYSATHGIHYGLASPGYTHFTSPIRRYPDLVVHRLLRHAVRVEQKREKKPGEKDFSRMDEELNEICEHCSYRERLAADAERESIKLKQVRAMTKHLGEEYDAEVTGMTDSGLFVKITDPYCEGMVSVESMTDDFYQYNEERMVMYGRRKKRTFKIGDPMRVRVLRADIEKRQIDFGMID